MRGIAAAVGRQVALVVEATESVMARISAALAVQVSFALEGGSLEIFGTSGAAPTHR